MGKEMAIHFSILPWEIPRTEEPGGLQSMGSQRIRHHGLWGRTESDTTEATAAAAAVVTKQHTQNPGWKKKKTAERTQTGVLSYRIFLFFC